MAAYNWAEIIRAKQTNAIFSQFNNKNMKRYNLFILPFLAFSFNVFGQTMTIADQGRVGIRNDAPLYTFHLKHDVGTPAAGKANGLAIAPDEGPTWVLYNSASTNELRFYRDGIPEVYFGPDGTINTLSDGRRKENIMPLPNGQLEKLLKITPKSYQYKDSPTKKTCAGFIAQELYTVFPSVVQYTPSDDDGQESWMVSYISLVPYLVKGIQEQQDKIEAQQKQIDQLLQQQQEILERINKLEKH